VLRVVPQIDHRVPIRFEIPRYPYSQEHPRAPSLFAQLTLLRRASARACRVPTRVVDSRLFRTLSDWNRGALQSRYDARRRFVQWKHGASGHIQQRVIERFARQVRERFQSTTSLQ
jgi:hypothetical protein